MLRHLPEPAAAEDDARALVAGRSERCLVSIMTSSLRRASLRRDGRRQRVPRDGGFAPARPMRDGRGWCDERADGDHDPFSHEIAGRNPGRCAALRTVDLRRGRRRRAGEALRGGPYPHARDRRPLVQEQPRQCEWPGDRPVADLVAVPPEELAEEEAHAEEMVDRADHVHLRELPRARARAAASGRRSRRCSSRSARGSARCRGATFHAAAIWSASVGPPSTDQPVKMTPLVRTSRASDSARRTRTADRRDAMRAVRADVAIAESTITRSDVMARELGGVRDGALDDIFTHHRAAAGRHREKR